MYEIFADDDLSCGQLDGTFPREKKNRYGKSRKVLARRILS